jgi:hypothetical protein
MEGLEPSEKKLHSGKRSDSVLARRVNFTTAKAAGRYYPQVNDFVDLFRNFVYCGHRSWMDMEGRNLLEDAIELR